METADKMEGNWKSRHKEAFVRDFNRKTMNSRLKGVVSEPGHPLGLIMAVDTMNRSVLNFLKEYATEIRVIDEWDIVFIKFRITEAKLAWVLESENDMPIIT